METLKRCIEEARNDIAQQTYDHQDMVAIAKDTLREPLLKEEEAEQIAWYVFGVMRGMPRKFSVTCVREFLAYQNKKERI